MRSETSGWLLAGIAAVVAVSTFGLARDMRRSQPSPVAASSSPVATTAAAARRPIVLPPGTVVVAHARPRELVVYRRPRGPVLTRLPPATRRPVLLARTSRRWTWPAWVEVYVPQRPNGALGWIRASDARFLLDPYRVRVDLRTHRIAVWKRGRRIVSAPVGVGRSVTPTPTGRYFLVDLLRPPNPHGLYGPYAFGTSAFSTALYHFGGGPGQIGLHGTDAPKGLGRDVSHGCIRVSNRLIVRLARTLPLGTPLDIVG